MNTSSKEEASIRARHSTNTPEFYLLKDAEDQHHMWSEAEVMREGAFVKREDALRPCKGQRRVHGVCVPPHRCIVDTRPRYVDRVDLRFF